MFSYDFFQIMTNTRANARSEDGGNEDQYIPPQGGQAPTQIPNDPQMGMSP